MRVHDAPPASFAGSTLTEDAVPWPHGRAADPDYASEYAAQRFALYGIAADPTADEHTTVYASASVNAWQPLGEWSRASDGDGWVASGPLQYSYLSLIHI